MLSATRLIPSCAACVHNENKWRTHLKRLGLSRVERGSCLHTQMKQMKVAKLFLVLWCVMLGALLVTTAWFPGYTVLSDASSANGTGTPTPDPLAEPALPAVPSQADYGAQVYWLHCMACHGNKGQGLTAEFRQLYPQDHQDCWKSGCHGHRPYTNGFVLPTVVPPLIGNSVLDNFSTAAALYNFISNAMPFQAPGSLNSTQYYQIVAFLLRQNGLRNSTTEIDASNAAQIPIVMKGGTTAPTVQQPPAQKTNEGVPWIIFAGFVLIILILLIILAFRNKAKGAGLK